MNEWLRIRCPNERRNGSNLRCGNTLKFVDKPIKDCNEVILCSVCHAQVFITYNTVGGCTVAVADNKKFIPSKDYPAIAIGPSRRGRQ